MQHHNLELTVPKGAQHGHPGSQSISPVPACTARPRAAHERERTQPGH
jgi:hypothetical protein